MNVLLLGMCNPDESVGAVIRAARRLGLNLHHYALKHHLSVDGEDRVHADLRGLCASAPDAVWLYNHHNAPGFAPRFCSWLRDAGARKVVFFSMDDPHKYRQTFAVDPHHWGTEADVVLTCTLETTHLYRELGVPAFWVPLGMDPEYHRPLEAWEREDTSTHARGDAVFVLTNPYTTAAFPFALIDRLALIDALARPSRHVQLRVYGPRARVGHLPGYVDWCYWNDIRMALGQSTCALNTHVDGGHAGYLNERDLQITGCGGGLMVSDAIAGYDLVFRPNVEAVYARDLAEMIDLTWYWSQPERAGKRDAMVAAARARALEWTYDRMVWAVQLAARGEYVDGPWGLPAYWTKEQ